MSRQRRKPPALPRSYEDYEELGRLFQDAERTLAPPRSEEAVEKLNQLHDKATLMWMLTDPVPAVPAEVSYLGQLRDDVRESRDYPPYGDFLPRLEEFRQFVVSEYGQSKRRAELREEAFVSDAKPDPPPYLV